MRKRIVACLVAVSAGATIVLMMSDGLVSSGNVTSEVAAVSQVPAPSGTPAQTTPRTGEGRPDLQGVWQAVNTASWNLEDHSPGYNTPGGYGVVEGGRIPYVPAALAVKRDNYARRELRDPEASCYLPGVPRATYMPFPFQILQFPDMVVVVYEYLGTTRAINLSGQHPDPEIVQLWMGDSRGRWDGNTLVVDVANFTDRTWFDRAGNFHTEALHVVERYTRTGPDHIAYEATIEDPNVFSRPWTIRMPLYRRQEPNLRLLDYECHAYMEEEAAKGRIKLPWSELEFEGIPRR
jgi:hypothetical protein